MSTTVWESVLTMPVSEDRDHIRGPANAAVTLVEYGDYECPYCGAAYPIIKEVQARMGRRLRFVFRNFPITTSHPDAEQAAEAAEAAATQGKFWQMHDLLYANQGRLRDQDLRAYAEELGLDVERFDKELAGHVHAERIHEDFLSGVRSGVNGTPTFYINGARHDGSYELEPLLRALERAGASEQGMNRREEREPERVKQCKDDDQRGGDPSRADRRQPDEAGKQDRAVAAHTLEHAGRQRQQERAQLASDHQPQRGRRIFLRDRQRRIDAEIRDRDSNGRGRPAAPDCRGLRCRCDRGPCP